MSDDTEEAVVNWILYGKEAKDEFIQKIRDIMINQTNTHKQNCRCHHCICLTELGYKKKGG